LNCRVVIVVLLVIEPLYHTRKILKMEAVEKVGDNRWTRAECRIREQNVELINKNPPFGDFLFS